MVRAAKAVVSIDNDDVAELSWPKDDLKGDAKKRCNWLLARVQRKLA
jgi:hypothetical protein